MKFNIKGISVIILFLLIATSYLYGNNCPIIFVHGQKGAGDDNKVVPDDGWPDWNGAEHGKPYRTAMDKILAEHYGGYTKGSPLDCHVNTQLASTGGETRKIYNFSYYNPDGSKGVIGSNRYVLPEDYKNWKTKSLKSDDLWIPPTLSSETSCWGCCLLPIAGLLIVRESFKKEPQADSIKSITEAKISLALSYSLGVAYRGSHLRSAEGEDLFQNPSWWTYWNNILSTQISFYFNRHWGLRLGCGYMWTHLENTVFDFDIHTESVNYPWIPVGQDKWNIYSGFGSIGIESRSPTYRKGISRNLGIGLEYYFSNGVVEDSMGRYDPQKGISEFRHVKGQSSNRGMGFFFSIGFERIIKFPIKWHVALLLRYGLAKCWKQSTSQKDVVWRRPINFNFSGAYFRVGISYNFLKKGG